jgi:cytochrome d ubiquinol oxidase subunit I
MAALTAWAVYRSYRPAAHTPRWMRWAPWIIPMPYLANTAGWILTETGRQPWIVHGLLKTADGISPNLAPNAAAASLLILAAVYTTLVVVDAFLLSRTANAGLAAEESEPVSEPAV